MGLQVPADMRVPKTIEMRRVRIAGDIGVSMMKTMVAGPLYGRARRKPQRHGESFQPLRQAQRLVRERAMVAQVDADTRDEVVGQAKNAQ